MTDLQAVGVKMTRYVLALAVALTSCGPGTLEPGTAGTASSKPASAEQECLAAANRRPVAKSGRPESIKVSHLLVKHAASKNPKEGVTRTRGQACLRAAEARDRILAGTPFEEAVATYSDEDGAASRAGSLGDIDRTRFDAAFTDTAFDLDRGQMSDVVETPFGFHLILRTE